MRECHLEAQVSSAPGSVHERTRSFALRFDLVDEPIEVLEGLKGKLRNGIWLRAINFYGDRLSFEVYASRPFGADEFVELILFDDAGTEYEMVSPVEGDVIDGHGSIVFRPGLPAGVNFHLSRPGFGLHSLGRKPVPEPGS